jgi:hypothetical protein
MSKTGGVLHSELAPRVVVAVVWNVEAVWLLKVRPPSDKMVPMAVLIQNGWLLLMIKKKTFFPLTAWRSIGVI